MKRFREPSWNNPVVRILDGSGKDLVRREDDYTAARLLKRMAAALAAAGRPVPEYLRLAAFELNPTRRETATFAMHCYWEGERRLGALDGVLATRIGALDGHEVVEVEFDPASLEFRALLEAARALGCARRVFARSDEQMRIAREVAPEAAVRSDARIDAGTTQQYHLAHRPRYGLVPLTALQATKVNAALAAGGSPDALLSPGQRALAARIEAALAQPARKAALDRLVPDRSAAGVARYAAELERALGEAAKDP